MLTAFSYRWLNLCIVTIQRRLSSCAILPFTTITYWQQRFRQSQLCTRKRSQSMLAFAGDGRGCGKDLLRRRWLLYSLLHFMDEAMDSCWLRPPSGLFLQAGPSATRPSLYVYTHGIYARLGHGVAATERRPAPMVRTHVQTSQRQK